VGISSILCRAFGITDRGSATGAELIRDPRRARTVGYDRRLGR
jgi:hypothetical protein